MKYFLVSLVVAGLMGGSGIIYSSGDPQCVSTDVSDGEAPPLESVDDCKEY